MTSVHSAEFLRAPRADWFQRAACKGQDVDIFFVSTGEAIWDALSFCSRCEVRRECLKYAIDNGIELGVWGGKSPRARRDPDRRNADVPIPTRDRIVELWGQRYTNRRIALELQISEQQVYACLARYRKSRHA